MITFTEFLKKMQNEELWNTAGPQDNPSNPGTKRKPAEAWLNKRYGGKSGGAGVTGVTQGLMQPQVRESH